MGVNLLYRLRTYYINSIFSSNNYYKGSNSNRRRCSLGGDSPEYIWNQGVTITHGRPEYGGVWQQC